MDCVACSHSCTLIHTWNEALDTLRSLTLLRKLEMSTTESAVRWMDHVSALSDFLLVQWLNDAVSTAGCQLRTNKKGSIFKNCKSLRIPDKTVVVVFKKLLQNLPKEHNENSETEQRVTQHIYIKNWSTAWAQVFSSYFESISKRIWKVLSNWKK
jgi:hypothetical protein